MQKVLLISDEIDFCLLMKYYFTRKNVACQYCSNLRTALRIIELERPDTIYVDEFLEPNIQTHLRNEISLIPGFEPSINLIPGSKPASGDWSLMIDIDKLVKYIKDKFKS